MNGMMPSSSQILSELREKEVYVEIRGDWIKVHLPSTKTPHTWKHLRSGVTTFSRTSRLNLLKQSAMIDWGRNPNPLFITLTLPQEVSEPTPERWKSIRDDMHRSMEKYLKAKLPLIWRTEWKPRLSGSNMGTWCPHLHMLAFTKRYIPWELLSSWWQHHIRFAGPVTTDIERVESREAAKHYLSKYVAKVSAVDPSLDNGTYRSKGRHWGIRRKGLIRMGRYEFFWKLDQAELWPFLCAASAAMAHFDINCPSSFSLFMSSGRKAVERLRENRIDNFTIG